MLRRLVFLPLLLVALASVGCCTCSNRMYCGGGACSPCGGGCGERYVHEFISDPPCCGDPCNGCGGFNGGCGNCARPFCFPFLWGGILGRRCDCGGCGSACGCGGSGCDSCGGGYSDGYAGDGFVDGGHIVQNGGPGPQVVSKPVQQQRSVMSPRPTPQMAPRQAPPSPTARKPVQGKTTGMPRNQLQRTGNVRLMSYEDEATEQPANASAQTISHRANFVR